VADFENIVGTFSQVFLVSLTTTSFEPSCLI